MKKKIAARNPWSKNFLFLFVGFLALFFLPSVNIQAKTTEDVQEVILRICNWEEYIDLGGWEEGIDLESGEIIGVSSMIEDFETWYYETYGVIVHVEYSTFGTNEDLYNMLTLGDVYDLVCPSEYMVMKLMAEDALVPLSESFLDSSLPDNYYARGLSPYIQEVLESHEINGESWSTYMAGYTWGITGILYNPEEVSAEDASSWTILSNTDYRRQITLKDNVRDSYFAAVGAIKSEILTSAAFLNSAEYSQHLEEEMNDISAETMEAVEKYLQEIKDNAYSFETDSGKADMITGKVVAGYQWSGDAVYAMDQAEEEGYTLCFSVPVESTNLYFDAWVMLKSGIEDDEAKQQAAEAFINFISRPDNVIRNMYYIGYTSVISGGDDSRIFEYVNWCYGADAKEDLVEYSLGYFFSGESDDEDYVIYTCLDQLNRQLSAQYPSEETLQRAVIMDYFDTETSEAINQMWIHVRCYNINEIPLVLRILAVVLVCVMIGYLARARIRRILSHRQSRSSVLYSIHNKKESKR